MADESLVDSQSGTIAIVTAVFFGLSVVAVFLRFFVRLHLIRAFSWDDAIMLVALVSSAFFINEEMSYIDTI